MQFSKAFNKVLHGRLILRIMIHGSYCNCSWLTHRRQRVVGWKSVSVAGDVPWGSVLGPLMHGQKVDKLIGEIAQKMAM